MAEAEAEAEAEIKLFRVMKKTVTMSSGRTNITKLQNVNNNNKNNNK